jgi:hypothetical protein
LKTIRGVAARWHLASDKFMQKFGALLSGADGEKILEQLQSTSTA